MSTQARQAVANSPKIKYTDSSQKSDLLDPAKTNTYLIAMLQWFLDNLWLPIMVLAVKSDHSPTGQHYDGCALDCYPANWQTGEQSTCTDMMTAAAKCPFTEAVGLGGITKKWKGNVNWNQPGSQYSTVFDDNDTDHIHIACANNVDPPGKRAQAMGYTKYTG
jgi:hypothetical protein